MVNIVWFILIILGLLFSFATGNVSLISAEIISSCEKAFDLILKMFPVIALWMGLSKIAEDSGLLAKFSNVIKPLLRKIFPSLKENSKAYGYIASNISANALGLGSAATPFGLKAMEELQNENEQKDVASDAMITFLILNTSGITIVPATVIALRLAYGSINPTEIILTSFLATIIACSLALIVDYIIRRQRN